MALNARILLSIILFRLFTPLAPASEWQWEVIYLHPPEFQESIALAVTPTAVAGRVEETNVGIPVLWQIPSGTVVDMRPPWAIGGQVLGASGNTQVGYLHDESSGSGGIWHGNAASFTPLSPAANLVSPIVTALAGDQKVGFATHITEGLPHALLWRAGAQVGVDLDPPGTRWSEAYATDGSRQGGWVDINSGPGGLHAALWNGTAASFVDLNPAGATQSIVLGMAPGVQVGWVIAPDGHDHAALWRGTAQSFVDLHPPGGRNSHVEATTGAIHAGYSSFTGWGHAVIWMSDDPADFLDLHGYLSPEWYSSSLSAICESGGRIYAAGAGGRTLVPEAILWIGRRVDTEPPARHPTTTRPGRITPVP